MQQLNTGPARWLALSCAAFGVFLVCNRIYRQAVTYASDSFPLVDPYSGEILPVAVHTIVSGQLWNLFQLAFSAILLAFALPLRIGSTAMRTLLLLFGLLCLLLVASDAAYFVRELTGDYDTRLGYALTMLLSLAWFLCLAALALILRKRIGGAPVPIPATHAGPRQGPDPLAALGKLKALLDSGALSAEDFEREKRKLLE